MPTRWLTGLVACVLSASLIFRSPSPTFADDRESSFLTGGETVIFFGDSITQNGGYVNYFEAYLLTRFPDETFRIINHGISSETISGTSEEDHDPRRPWALPRFTRDITKWNPDVVVSCFGMNDGNYHPFEPVRFQKYRNGIRTLIERTKREAKAKLVLMTPPPYDPYRRRVSDPAAKTYGYKFPAVDYDETLRRYSEWLVSLRKKGQTVVDLHSAMNAHLKQRRKKRVSYFFSPDGVHPNSTGHWLMTQHLLLELNAPSTAADVRINATTRKSDDDSISNVKRSSGGLTFQWVSPLPMPHDPAWETESIKLERVAERFNRYRLSVTGLKQTMYALTVNGTQVGTATAQQLAAGVNLLSFEKLPTMKASGELLKLVKQRRRLNYRLWRTQIGKPVGKALSKPRIAQTKQQIAELGRQIAQRRQPRRLRWTIAPHPSPE